MSAVSVAAMDSSESRRGPDDNFIEAQRISDVMTRSKQKTQNRRKVRKSGMVEEDFDDSASASSSMSSASEHSVKNDTKVKKVRKQHCHIHSKSPSEKVIETSGNVGTLNCNKQLDGVVGEDDITGNNESAETIRLKCTCQKNLKKNLPSKSMVKRPEPEGSLLSDHSKVCCFVDDLERVIYSSEPLFSDMEDEDSKLEEQIRAESERFHRRVANPENIFSAVQMLNTNTMMKLAIIQTELKNVKDVSLRRSEGEIVSAAKRAEVLHESFQHTENSLKSVSSQISEASKAIGPLIRCQPGSTQDKKTSMDDEKWNLLVDKEQQRLSAVSPDVVSKRRSLGGKRLVNEVDLEMARHNLEAAEMTISEIEEEQMVISNAKKSRNTSEFEEIIRRLSQRLGQAEKQARDAEQVILYIGQQLRNLQETRLADKMKYRPISSELTASFAELSVFLS